ncbi:MAG: M48 family metallopeptidase [Planctomycetes bacterium]|nr:M48 family metallopeptidase [Planctomycetota bacterium]
MLPSHRIHPIAWRMLVWLSVQLLVAMGSNPLQAQPFKLPFTDPQKMFEQAFGEDSEEDRQALEKIEVSVSDERLLGKQILQSELASLKVSGIAVVTKGRDVDYLNSLVATLQPQMRNRDRYPKIDVIVVRSRRIDARSCPGGTLMFYEGLLDAAGSEAALAGIVGHELSHLDRGHQLLPIRRMKLMEKSLSSPQNLSQFLQSGPAMTKLWARPFRPEDERDADRDGVEWSYAAGYDPREMAKLFQKKGVKSPGAEGMPWASFFRSHPYNHERHKAILDRYKQLAKEHPPATPLFVGTENLANRFSRQQEMDAAK